MNEDKKPRMSCKDIYQFKKVKKTSNFLTIHNFNNAFKNLSDLDVNIAKHALNVHN